MYRSWLGVGLLLVLLVFGLTVSTLLRTLQTPISARLEEAAQQVLSGQSQKAYITARKAHRMWEDRWHLTAAFSDHAPMDEIDGLFGQLRSYAQDQNFREFAACSRRISILVDALWEAHSLNWWNLL